MSDPLVTRSASMVFWLIVVEVIVEGQLVSWASDRQALSVVA
jgi:hypothetical protein